MCGIAGFASCSPKVSGSTLYTMRESLSHRGPDQAGLWLDKEAAPCRGLAHRRLSIIDLSKAGQQPLSNEDKSVWISYNGECYNYQKLMQDLLQAGHSFRSTTDTEVLVHGYEEWGLSGLLSRLNGMFAFALWDQHTEELYLVRDRLGKKPLYYMQQGDLLLFASEIKAFAAAGFLDPTEVDAAALVQFWLYGYSTGSHTIHRQVRRLLPGHYLVWRQGKISLHEYWDLPWGTAEAKQRSLDDLADELEALLTDAVRLRLIADVPVGVFLSGGIDSSLIAALAAKITNKAVQSFSIGFTEKQFDETRYAQAVAEHLGIPNTLLRVDEEMQPFFRPIARHFDELFGDSSAIPTWFVAKLAKKHVSVALTGDAGDELCAGYDSYAKALSIWGNRQERRLFKQRVGRVQQVVDYLQLRYVPKKERLSALERLLPLSGLHRILQPKVWEELSLSEALYERERWYDRVAGADLLSQLQYVNLKTYLPDDILVKVDRMSMAHALECRCPLLDYRVVELAAQLSFSQKISPEGKGKYLLRHLLQRYLPKELIDRPKMGFSIPWSQWCQGPLGQELKAQWQTMQNPYLRQEAAEYLFPAKRLGWPARQWNAFCTLVHWGQEA